MSRIILASASPRRKELLEQIGLEFEICPAKGEEVITKKEPQDVVMELSKQKAEEVACVVTGLSVKNFSKEGAQLEGVLKISSCIFERVEARYVTHAEEGELLQQKDCAITIFLPKKGDDVWEVAKKMGVSPDEVVKCNPDVKFPVGDGTRIVVYRQKKDGKGREIAEKGDK